MIKTTGILVQELEHYANPVAKIRPICLLNLRCHTTD